MNRNSATLEQVAKSYEKVTRLFEEVQGKLSRKQKEDAKKIFDRYKPLYEKYLKQQEAGFERSEQEEKDAIEALVVLGMTKAQASKAVQRVVKLEPSISGNAEK